MTGMLRHRRIPIPVEYCSGNQPPFAGAFRHFLLLVAMAFALLAPARARATQQDIPAPSGAGTSYAKVAVLPNGNIVVADPSYTAPGGQSEAGAVFLLRGTDLTVISTLKGVNASDHCGAGISVLPNGNFLVFSGYSSQGALAWGSMLTGVDGPISTSNALIGFGIGSVTVLSNSDYVVRSSGFNFTGAMTFGSGTSGAAGPISSANSIVGGSSNENVGDGGIIELANGNYVILTHYGNSGAVTFCSAATGRSGVLSYLNSLIGKDGDQIGFSSGAPSVYPLPNGNYVICSPQWVDPGQGANHGGAITWVSGTTGPAGMNGEILPSNSLIGDVHNDHAGSGGIAVLANGNYVVCSPEWDDFAHGLSNAGAVTWCSGTARTVGRIGPTNSLVGDATTSLSATAASLTDGNYVLCLPNWSGGKGAAIWMNGTTPLSGTFAMGNALVGSVNGDSVGTGGVVALPGGRYLVRSPYWHNGASGDVGAVTWMAGGGAVAATVSTANSLYGSTAGDQIGGGEITLLPNGNYLVRSPLWHAGAATGAGAVTWGDGANLTAGPVSAANSIVGSSADDSVGLEPPTILSNGNYVVTTRLWDRGAVVDAGAVTWGSGTGPAAKVISASNSIVGSHADDQAGNFGVAALANGNYVVRSPQWDNGSTANVGALTWGNGLTGTGGAISATNSLVGSTAEDGIGGDELVALANGDYLAKSPQWDHAAISNAGAVTYLKGDGSTVGSIKPANSVLGTITGDIISFSFDATGSRTFVGRSSKFLTIFTPTPPNSAPTDITLSNSSLAENNAVDATVGTLSATDADAGQTHTFELVYGDGTTDYASFEIIGTTLKIKVAADFETKSSYSIRVRATDNGDPAASFEKVLTITVTDVPENDAPTDIALSNSTLAENNLAGATVGTLSATDPDAGQTLGFTLASGTGSTDNAAFTISGSTLQLNSIADFETKRSYSVRIRATDNGTPVRTFEKAFTITITNVIEGPPVADDAVRVGNSPAVIYPLANDANPHTTIVSVSNPEVLITGDGRTLTMQPGFQGTFQYTTAAGTTASVTATGGFLPAIVSQYNGLLYDENSGKVAGWAVATFNARGFVTTKAIVGGAVASKSWNHSLWGNAPSRLGEIFIQYLDDGTLGYSIHRPDGSSSFHFISGRLRPIRPVQLLLQPGQVAPPSPTRSYKYHAALASIDPAIPGGGLLVATVSKKERVAMKGLLPDGRPFTSGSGVSENGTIAFYARPATKPASTVAGEVVFANLPATDFTGELSWFKPEQSPHAHGLHLGGVDTILTANGSFYGSTLPTGTSGTLRLSGGDLTADESSTVPIVAGKPAFPVGSLVSWGRVDPATGKFTPKVRIPGLPRPVTGTGLYLPKSHTAWAFFPGTTIGGRIALTVP